MELNEATGETKHPVALLAACPNAFMRCTLRSQALQRELEELVISLSAQGRGALDTSPPRPSRSQQQQRHTRPVSPAWSPAGRAAARSPARGGGGALKAESFGLEGRCRYVGSEQDGLAREYPEVCSQW